MAKNPIPELSRAVAARLDSIVAVLPPDWQVTLICASGSDIKNSFFLTTIPLDRLQEVFGHLCSDEAKDTGVVHG